MFAFLKIFQILKYFSISKKSENHLSILMSYYQQDSIKTAGQFMVLLECIFLDLFLEMVIY